MARLKLNLSTGVVVEKPVVTCFNINEKSYLVLDAESNGSMGLPIILVCKIDNGKVVKITDATEWQQAKDYLKGIIAGNTMNYIPVAAEMSADEVYYTQLTLPVASFDVIKNSYKVVESSVAAEEVPVVENVAVVEPTIPETNTPEAPVIDLTVAVEPETTPEIKPDEPVIPKVAVNEPVIPEPETASVTSELDYNEIKVAFMKACENMFDALVSKFQAELDSKK